MAEEALVRRDADARAVHLAAGGQTADLPGELADLGDRLGRYGLSEAAEAAAGVDRDTAAESGLAVVQQRRTRRSGTRRSGTRRSG